MIDGDELHLVGVGRLPELLGQLQHVTTVTRLERVTGDAHVFLRRARRGKGGVGAAAHQSQRHPERATPHGVGDEAETLAIPRIGERARALKHLALDDVLIGAGEVNRLRDSVGPLDAQHIRLQMRTETEMRHSIGGNAGLVDITSAQLQARTDSERVILAASVAEAFELHVHREIAVAAFIAQKSRRARPVDQPEIFVPVFIDIGNRNGRRPPRTHSWRNQTRLIGELALPVISKEEYRRLSRHNKIEPAVVVEVDEFGRRHTVRAHRLQCGRRAAVAGEGAVALVEPER